MPEDALELINIAEIRAHAEYLGVAEISRKDRWVTIRFAGGVKVHPFVFVMAKSEYGDKIALSDGRAAVLRFHTGKDLDIPAILGLMRFLRESKEESRNFEQ